VLQPSISGTAQLRCRPREPGATTSGIRAASHPIAYRLRSRDLLPEVVKGHQQVGRELVCLALDITNAGASGGDGVLVAAQAIRVRA
jgi:hypothetical protein